MDKSKKNSRKAMLILTPLILLLLSVGILIIAGIKPYNKLSMYLNLAFMDEFQTNPNDEQSGLTIREGDIILDYSGEISTEGEIIRPVYGEQFAVLRSDVLEVNVPVYWGSGRELLQRGACQASYSKLPGEEGNVVISAHADTFFSELRNAEIGEVFTLNTSYGEFIYKVTEKISFKNTNKKYVSSTESTQLTLYTCKKDIFGSSDQRIGVVCELTEAKFYVQAEEAEN